MYNGDCYPNGSYFRDVAITDPQSLDCVLPNSTLNGGEWTRTHGLGTVDCTNSTYNNNLQCNITDSPASLALYRPSGVGFGIPEDQLHKCCLPTSCSDPSTNIITAHIFSKLFHIVLVHMILSLLVTVGRVQIANFSVELPSDITTLPQQFTLHCITTGDGIYNVSFNYTNQPTNIINIQCPSDCTNHRQLLHSSNTTYDNNITLTWDTETITNETSFSQSSNGDQMYKCHVQSYEVNRESTLIIRGNNNN